MTTNKTRLGIVILAAGEGTRMRSLLPKVLHTICGRSLLGHVLAVADTFEQATTALVLATSTIDPIRDQLGDGPKPSFPYRYTTQAQRLGTGHAVLQARDLLQGECDEVLVMFGDTPLLRAETVQRVVEARRTANAKLALLSFHANPLVGYGRVVRNSNNDVISLVEERNASPEQRAITEGNSGIMCMDAEWLWPTLDLIRPNDVNGEYYLTDLVALAVDRYGAGSVIAVPATDEQEAWGVNDRVQLAQAGKVLRDRKLEQLMRSGITVIDPANTYVDVDVAIGHNCTILPGTILQGQTTIGKDCTIGPFTTISDSFIGDGASLSHAVIERSTIAAGTTLGPFIHITDDNPSDNRRNTP